MAAFISKLILDFFTALGIVTGGSLLGGVASVLTLKSPGVEMARIAASLKIWAMVAAVGGTIDPLRVIETNFAEGYISPAAKQILYFITAFAGAHTGYALIEWICKGSGDA
ncbi:MAG: YtrH family sporulation protein [Paenibacillaceae bacterium]|uniref:YtrH family sporulation protein n=1 Tax=Paenibacillus cymbidii TaxID=1639034 RepID=UPI0010816017|nr:YtrH family sporulation protein [Paenibacillus cymbidii]MBO9610295.1 YtrH family sporulation protein [Paenibacillaceae bacterium]